jgi:F-type H+-transporting ATPase subunit epsilon
MADKFTLEIVTPARVVLSEEVDTVPAPGSDGEFGVLREHTLLITPLKPGEICYVTDKGQESLAVGSGYAEVWPDKTVILVDSAFSADEINADEAASELRLAEEALSGVSEADEARKKLEAAVALAKAKLSVVEGGSGS